MSVCRKLPDGTIQKIAGHTILLDANASEVREGTINIPAYSGEPRYHILQVTLSDPMPDNDYAVDWNVDRNSPYWAEKYIKVGTKTTTGFEFLIAIDGTGDTLAGTVLHYIAWKPIKLDGYTALQNKVNSPDETPTKDSMNLVTSDGVARAIENAGAVWRGTKAEWNALPATEKAKYDQAEVIDEYTGVPVVVDKVEAGNLNPVTSSAVAGKVPQQYWARKVQAWGTGDIDVVFTAPAGKKFIFGTGSMLDDRRAYVSVMDEAPIVSADGKSITLKFYTYSVSSGIVPTQCHIYLNALVVDE